MNDKAQSTRNPEEHHSDFTIESEGIVKLNKCIVLNSIPAGFYEPIHFQNRYVSIKSLLEKIKVPVTVTGRYFPMEEWHPGFKNVESQISAFLKNRKSYAQNGLPYKRSLLLYGEAGTGKSTFINHTCKTLIENYNALVIKIDNFGRLKGFNQYLASECDVIKDRLKVLVIEDVEKFRDEYALSELTNLLNRKELSHNTLMLMTSTLPQAIPDKLVQSSTHINNLTGVFNKDFKRGFLKNWYNFLVNESLSDEEQRKPWYLEVKGNLAPAYLKDLFLSSLLNERSFQEGWEDMKTRKAQLGEQFGKALDLFEEENEGVTEQDLLDLLEALEA